MHYALQAQTCLALLEGRRADAERLTNEALAIGQGQPGFDVVGVYGQQMFGIRGRSNKEIARALDLSENTVANHVRSILAKTGTANRTEAAGFARQSGLA